ncbi:O-antigen ligase [Bacillus sp. V5-8f]|uniref:O-antigen ligase family protein n=1 Tax=Bacillus sp. V5-8f TaxID=2053044 RepID=UPI000C781789|nr:O-antigen ligase family protein [Bacillus sp. V5-8f]PLT35721.1 hypothetical protein CUU64_00110 [Bacillus sp. V5-8f]
MLVNKSQTFIQIILACFIAAVLGYASMKVEVNLLYGAAALLLLILALFVITFYIVCFWRNRGWDYRIYALTIASSFIGAALVSVKVASISIFPFRILIAFTWLLVIIEMIKRRQLTYFRDVNVKWVFYYFIFWILYGLVAMNWSAQPIETVKELIFLGTGISLVILTVALLRDEKSYIEFFTIWIVMGILLIGIGLVNNLLQIHLPISRITEVSAYQKHIPTSVFVNENDFGSFLAISFFFFVSLAKNGKRIIYNLIGAMGALLSVYLIVETNSRANYIAVALGAVFWFLFLLNRRQKMAFTLLAAIPFIGILFVLRSRLDNIFLNLSSQITSLLPGNGGGAAGSVDIRENLLRNARTFIENSFGFGISPGNVEFYMKNFGVYDTHQDYNIHNWWAEIFVHYGLLIFTGYILLFIFLFISLYKIKRTIRTNHTKLITEALLCSILVFIFSSISPNSFMALNYNWLFLAFAVGYVNLHSNKAQHIGGKNV